MDLANIEFKDANDCDVKALRQVALLINRKYKEFMYQTMFENIDKDSSTDEWLAVIKEFQTKYNSPASDDNDDNKYC